MRRYLVVLVMLCACGGEPRAPRAVAVPPAEAAKLLIDRNWLDRWPAHEDDQLHVYRFTPAMGGGVYQDRTLYAGSFELFLFSVDGDRIELTLPHRKERARVQFTIERVDGPAPFDLRLTLRGSPRGPDVYYGRSAERADEADLLPAGGRLGR